ncbi:hypothetical protein [Persicitalea jodogahamensis]|uniref:Chromate transporter n=1 Tax=Persicitalea jodogahamensis TaxID=402147 RepID=A0A8J3D968_9BACT|nr:hypothetical protein [Persicitalea jodogahamensis]GHB78381.1 hypothetical protein GCM10007390_35820 [Persicitalea jodogahamensis]
MEKELPLEKEMRDLFAKFPAFPDSLVEILVTVAPWGALIGAIFGILGFLGLVGVGSFVSVASIGVGAYGSTWKMWVSIIGLGIVAVIYLLAFSPLRARSKRGWDLMYYAFLLNLAINLITFSFFSLILSFIIGGWILFQVRPKYV